MASRPSGLPTEANFMLDEVDVPKVGLDQVLLQNVYLSIDPYMRWRMNDDKSYAAQFSVDMPMGGATVSRIAASQHPGFEVGSLVSAQGGWQEFALSDGSELRKLDPEMLTPSVFLGVLGITGFTAWHGFLAIGEPKIGETVVVAAASGAVGSVVGQIAKMKGCRAVGIAGGAEKCAYVVDELGFDACIDHHDPDFADILRDRTPDGIDIYFENVGGAVFDAVVPRLNNHARVPLCGLISAYNDDGLSVSVTSVPLLAKTLLMKSIRVQGFIISDQPDTEFEAFRNCMTAWIRDGKIKHLEDVTIGLENAPQVFIGLLQGRNFGKSIVRISEFESGTPQ